MDPEQITPEPAAVTPAPEPVATPEPTPAAGPWAADLAVYFEDETARSQADKYLREKIQPRMTQLEQTHSEYAPAREFLDDLRNDPNDTTLALIEELYGEGTANKFAELLASGVEPEVAEAVVAETAPQTDPELEEIKAERRAAKTRAQYDGELERIKATQDAQALPLPFDDAEYAVFVSQSEGDFDKALASYKAFLANVAQRVGLTPATAPEVPPPAALGTQPGGAPAAAPQTQTKYASIDDALDSFMDERRAQGPSVVGTV